MDAVSPEQRLQALGLELPDPPKPLASYVPVRQAGQILYTAGIVPTWNGVIRYRGTVGDDLSIDDAVKAAELCVLNIISLVKQATGSLAEVEQFLQLTGFVRSAPGFGDQPKVMNGASDLLVKVFADAGRHTRLALGTNELPLGVPVEISATIQLRAQQTAH